MTSKLPSTSLPPTHPLILELTSLRQQLHQYQTSAHQTAIQLQGTRLELSLAKEESMGLRQTCEVLKREIEVLRSNPIPPPTQPTSTALSELSLAHRRLSAKLDLTESQLTAAQLELASAKQEIQRRTKEREGDKAVINELRRIEEDREEEIEWERGERRRMEEQKKLCDLALDEYSHLVHSLDPTAVPPTTPKSQSTSILQSTPDLITPLSPPETPSSLSSPESISNLLLGQRGVHRLFTDFTSTLTSKERLVHTLQVRVEELERNVNILEEQLQSETSLRVNCQEERDKAMRDDASAAKVVERYMTFTQKTHATIHRHLDNLRQRSAATQASLRQETQLLRKALEEERSRSKRMIGAVDEMSEGLARESAGRRREIGLRLKLLSAEEQRAKRVEKWLERVRRLREGAEGAVLEADILENLVDDGVRAVTVTTRQNEVKRSWRGLLGRKEKFVENKEEEESVARVLLAEELVTTLVTDLQKETERRMELERQRVEWLAQDAVGGRLGHEDTNGHEMFDFDHEDHEEYEGDEHHDKFFHNHDTGNDAKGSTSVLDHDLINLTQETQHITMDDQPVNKSAIEDIGVRDEIDDMAEPSLHSDLQILNTKTTPPSPLLSKPSSPTLSLSSIQPTPELQNLLDIFNPLRSRYPKLQTQLHSLSHSLSSLRSSLPSNIPQTPNSHNNSGVKTNEIDSTPYSIKRKNILHPLRRISPIEDPHLTTILENIYEVLEDARVDLEIAIADEDRLFSGFEALLGVGSVVHSSQVLRDAKDYVDDRLGWEGYNKLERKIEELESDLTLIQRVLHESEGMELSFVQPSQPVSQIQLLPLSPSLSLSSEQHLQMEQSSSQCQIQQIQHSKTPNQQHQLSHEDQSSQCGSSLSPNHDQPYQNQSLPTSTINKQSPTILQTKQTPSFPNPLISRKSIWETINLKTVNSNTLQPSYPLTPLTPFTPFSSGKYNDFISQNGHTSYSNNQTYPNLSFQVNEEINGNNSRRYNGLSDNLAVAGGIIGDGDKGDRSGSGRSFAGMNQVSRSLSASVIGAPRRVGTLTGFYKKERSVSDHPISMDGGLEEVE
ncbi:hypothetical protein M231_01011 [Tremella mesenterica]|uniref:Uncharacterized protein n=1 Tax=Tremella mesenterica TaxID=5217 RepID=A0A4Q1BUV0_TREME|nr:hypothetical protein M231_01011 [Tremella mesenterica]